MPTDGLARSIRERSCAQFLSQTYCWPIIPNWGDRQVCLITCSMKAVFAFSLLVIMALLGGCTSPVQGPVAHTDVLTDLDFTTSTDFDAAGLVGGQRLRTFGTNNAPWFSDEYICGEYQSPEVLTAGHIFHVFPDGCFVIEESSDAGAPVATIVTGHWKREGDTLVISDLVYRNLAPAVLGMKWVREHFGSPERLRMFVTASGQSIGDKILIAEDTASKGPHIGWKYVRRTTQYADWPKKQRELMKQ